MGFAIGVCPYATAQVVLSLKIEITLLKDGFVSGPYSCVLVRAGCLQRFCDCFHVQPQCAGKRASPRIPECGVDFRVTDVCSGNRDADAFDTPLAHW